MPKPIHEQMDMKGLELLVDEVTITGAGGLNVATLAGVANLTDSSAGTATNTIVAIPAAVASVGADTSAATVVSVNASLAAIRNEVASLTAKVNAILTALK